MNELWVMFLFLGVLFALLGSGLWIGLSLFGTAFLSLALFGQIPTGDALVTSVWQSLTSWALASLPLFIWMGEILYRSRIAQDLFSGLSPWLGRVPGGLLHTNVVGSTLFAAVSGSSAATCEAVGRITIPELRQRRYPESLIMSTLAGPASLGLLIPPSLMMIVYGVSVDESISKLFVAGIVPGILLALLFSLYTAAVALLSRDWNVAPEPRVNFMARIRASRSLIAVAVLIMTVIGSMYVGIATATEAAAVGVFGSLVISAAQRSLTVGVLIESLKGAVKTSTMIALLLAGAAGLTLAMGYIGLPAKVAAGIAALHLSKTGVLIVIALFYLVLGMFLDGISTIVLTISIVQPIMLGLGVDPIWLGVFLVILVEAAQITPPVGFNLFILQGLSGHRLGYLARVSLPMFVIMMLMLCLITVWPGLATWLPGHL